MGEIVELPIASGFYESESLPIAAQECVNWYPNIPQTNSLSKATLFGTPGILELTTTGTVQQVNRGSHVKDGTPYFVNGTSLYELVRSVDSSGKETFSTNELGTIPGDKRVSMSDNGTQLMIVIPGEAGYIYNEDDATPFQQIADPDFTANGNPQAVVFIDGYFVVTTDEKKFIVSALNDGLSYNALDFGSAEADPDDIVAPMVYRNQLFILGSETCEVFQNQGGAGFPFIRINGYVFDKGLFSPFGIVKADSSFLMIGGGINESPAVWLFTGNGFAKVSTTAIDNVLQRFTDAEIQNSFTWSYAQKGAYFVGFTISDITLVYDIVTQRWHERKSTIGDFQDRLRVNSLVTAYGRVLVGDSQDGRIGSMDIDAYTEYGSEIRRVVASENFSTGLLSRRVSSIELTVESGVGNSDRKDPQVSMDWSDDGGKTFKYERRRSMGKVGEYTRRSIWRKNGRFPRFRVLRFKMSDPVKPVIINLVGNVS